MLDLGRKFMAAALGTDGAQALRKAAERDPRLDQILIPRAIVGWLSFTTAHEYEGQIPGIENSYVQFQKSEDGFSGSVTLNEGVYSFENASVYHLAASVALALGVETGPLDAKVRDAVLVKLGKSIDTLVKAQVLTQELKNAKSLAPQVITTHGKYHIEKDSSAEKPYSVVHTLSKSMVQKDIASLRDAGEIANWHQQKYKGYFNPKLSKKTLDPSLGISFHHEHHHLGDGDTITHIKAIHPSGQVVGEVAMEYNKNRSEGMKPDVSVHPDHRRKGIATAMYAHAEKLVGRPVAPSSAQSPDAQKLWAGSKGKFGKDEIGTGKAHEPWKQKGPIPPQGPQMQPANNKVAKGTVDPEHTGAWGGSHSSSMDVTHLSAKMMGIPGFEDYSGTQNDDIMARHFLTNMHNHRAPEMLYHQTMNYRNLPHNIGDTVDLPLTATSGEQPDMLYYSFKGYSWNRAQHPDFDKGALVYVFPKGVPYHPYRTHDPEEKESLGYHVGEGLVAGRFKVSHVEHKKEQYGQDQQPYKQVYLEPTHFFHPEHGWFSAQNKGAMFDPEAKKARSKTPSMSIGKAEAAQACPVCGGHQFEGNRFKGCMCFRELGKSVKTTAYGDGYVLEFDSTVDASTMKALMKNFRSRNG